MSITGQDISDRAKYLLKDASGVRWTEPELITWINDACSEMVSIKPSAIVKRSVIKLAAGAVQPVPADCVELLEVSRNMGLTGVIAGEAIRPIQKELLDSMMPGWASGAIAGNAKVKFVSKTATDQNTYFVYPPQPNTNQGYVELVYGVVPVKIEDLADIVGRIKVADTASYLSDNMVNAIVDYVLYRCFSKDDEVTPNAQRALNHYQAFRAAFAPPPQAAPQ